MTTTTQRRKLYVLEDPVWLNKAGFTKGIHHDRQHLGIIIAAGTQFKIRIVDGAEGTKLKLRTLNTDSKTEQSLEFTKEWLTVTVAVTSVPFVDTPYILQAPTVEFEYDSATTKILPIYKKYDPESNFFAEWDKQSAEFALVESDYVIILVPGGDKETLRALKTVPNINGLIDFYDRLLTFYNELSGISFEPHQETDRNIRNRYFLKADLHGAGGAYYGGSCAAATSSSIKDWWLSCSNSSWGVLHEIAHGYQGGFMSTAGFSAGEVWNNVYGASFENIHLGDKVWTDGWLYDFGKYNQVFDGIKKYMADRTPLDKWDLRAKLNFLMLLKDKGGNAGFTHFNQQYRKHANAPDFNPNRFTLLDMLSAAYSRVSKIDVTAVIQRVGGILTDEQIEKNRLFHEKVAYPLCELVTPAELPNVMTLLHLKNPLTLVHPSDLKPSGLTGDLKIKFNIESFLEIYGETFTLMEGQRYANNTKITDRTIAINALPIGVYTMILPTGKGIKYAVDKYYAIVKSGVNELELNYTPKTSSPLLSQGFNLLGLGNYQFANVKIDYISQTINIVVNSKEPHSYFAGQKYAQITIKGADGSVLFDKEYQGTNGTISDDKIPFKENYQLIFFHAEPDRLRPAITTEKSILAPKNKSNILTMTSAGVRNDTEGGDATFTYVKERIGLAATEARKNPRILRSKYDRRKDDIYLTIQNVPEPGRAELLAQYKDVIPTQNTTPGPEVGSAFLFTFLGLSDEEFFRVKVDFISNQITFTVKATQPHYYFYNSLYASVKFLDSNGIERFTQDFIGETHQVEKVITLPLCYFGGEKFYICHKEPGNRLVVTNQMQDKRFPTNRNNLFVFTQNGIDLVWQSGEEKNDAPALFSIL